MATKEGVTQNGGGAGGRRENDGGKREGNARSTRQRQGTICRESYINYSDVICMLMGYICMSTRK